MATKGRGASNEEHRKLALVIGIGEYENFDQLSNPENDARDMESALESIGFTVTMVLHLKRVAMKHALVKFEDSIQPGDMVLFYFAGHGTQWEDQNYLLPKDIPDAQKRAYNGYTVKVCDFGVARTRNETTRQTKSNNTLAITLQWTAPEILRLGRYTDKSDIYSLGIVYWELATYQIPYDGHEDGVIRAFVLAGDRLDIPDTTPSIFRMVIEQCWTQNPNDRPDGCHLIQMIEECIQVE
ncbi:unnamed protein product, partial [Rotaria sp. Silwood2]